MEIWLWMGITGLTGVVLFLAGKIYYLRKAAREIRRGLADRLDTDTNTLIDISSRDACMRGLASDLNRELRRLRGQRRRYLQGDLELKEAVTNVSHDLRTPLTAICGYLELLRAEEKSEQAARYLEIIGERTDAMRMLTEELLRYSVTKSAQEKLRTEEVVINRVLEESIAAYYGVLREKKIEPKILIPEEKIRRTLNQGALSRVFGNIISNAAKYSDGDLRIALLPTGEITFSNHASSLDELKTARLFGRYYTVDTAEDSTGLGLSIARTLTEQMGGRISAEYRDGVICIRMEFDAALHKPCKNEG